MLQEAKLIGSIANFALNGVVDVTTAGTVGKNFCPLNADLDAGGVACWVPVGVIENIKDSTKPGTTTEIYRPTVLGLQLDNLLESKFKRILTITVKECSNLMWLAMHRALVPSSPRLSPAAIGQYVGFTSGTIRGWLKLQNYNQDTGALEIAEQLYGCLAIDETSYGDDKPLSYSAVFTQLFSTLNTSNGS